MYYSYIIQSKKDNTFYYGHTDDLKKRLSEHNSGYSKYTSSKLPYVIVWYGAFVEKQKAIDFEKYLKSSSGHAFSRKRLLP
ncbi:MAG: GIY-YIG nuclease family protein [Candidatus Pacebacteria bacterium]|nr:GIY-YIG nuclease family protein [Candidatus Paceibacterota bacterium]MBP9780651.1 GIY-YIG nuclease family protein [Candidatus Paceibacterota bacterium]